MPLLGHTPCHYFQQHHEVMLVLQWLSVSCFNVCLLDKIKNITTLYYGTSSINTKMAELTNLSPGSLKSHHNMTLMYYEDTNSPLTLLGKLKLQMSFITIYGRHRFSSSPNNKHNTYTWHSCLHSLLLQFPHSIIIISFLISSRPECFYSGFSDNITSDHVMLI